MNKTTILIFHLLIANLFLCARNDTIKVVLKINGATVNHPSRHVTISFISRTDNQNIIFQDNILTCNESIADSSELVVKYKDKEVGRCWKYAPKTLTGIDGLTIEIFTKRKKILKKLNELSESVDDKLVIYSLCIMTTTRKFGNGTVCLQKDGTYR